MNTIIFVFLLLFVGANAFSRGFHHARGISKKSSSRIEDERCIDIPITSTLEHIEMIEKKYGSLMQHEHIKPKITVCIEEGPRTITIVDFVFYTITGISIFLVVFLTNCF